MDRVQIFTGPDYPAQLCHKLESLDVVITVIPEYNYICYKHIDTRYRTRV